MKTPKIEKLGYGLRDIGTMIRTNDGRPFRYSRNLRGLIDYARSARPVCVITRKDPTNETRGVLHVVYADGSTGRASFASFHILIDWVRNRRTWRGAEFRHIDGATGYLTRPGIIAGGA